MQLCIFSRTFQYRHENQEALGSHPNVTSYLSNRLGVTELEILEFAKKHPPVMRVHVAKMKEIIDYLMAEGYSTSSIVRTPRILCHSITTIQASEVSTSWIYSRCEYVRTSDKPGHSRMVVPFPDNRNVWLGFRGAYVSDKYYYPVASLGCVTVCDTFSCCRTDIL